MGLGKFCAEKDVVARAYCVCRESLGNKGWGWEGKYTYGCA